MTATTLTAQDYFRTALTVLGERGSDALTIAVLCERLQITKGSFYHHFGSMEGFVTGLLAFWELEHSDRLIAASKEQADPGLRIITLTEFAVTLPHAPEAAIRAWAHSNPTVAQAVARVDQRRDRVISEALAGMGIEQNRAKLFAQLALTLLVGIQNRDRNPDPARVRALFDEVIRSAFREADPAKLQQVSIEL